MSKSKTFIPHIFSGDSVTFFLNGTHSFPSTHLNYKEVIEAVKSGNEKELQNIISGKNRKGLEVLENDVLWNGEVLHTVAVKRLFEIKHAGFDTTPIIRFLENCQKNPFPQIVAKLYEFLESRGMPLTEDGCFLCYKYCNADYYDGWTGRTYQFLPGSHVVANNIENRDKICDLSGEECSGEGIHVGNYDYSGSQPNVVFVKVNPKDVLSSPVGHNAKKLRVWELDVLDVVDGKKEEIVVTSNGKKIDYIVGQELDCHYKNGDGKINNITGTILNIGEMYLELDKGYSIDGEINTSTKRRLKVTNIQKAF